MLLATAKQSESAMELAPSAKKKKNVYTLREIFVYIFQPQALAWRADVQTCIRVSNLMCLFCALVHRLAACLLVGSVRNLCVLAGNVSAFNFRANRQS